MLSTIYAAKSGMEEDQFQYIFQKIVSSILGDQIDTWNLL